MRTTILLLAPAVVLILTGCASTAASGPQKMEAVKQPPAGKEVTPEPEPAKYSPVKIGVVDLQQVSMKWRKWQRLEQHIAQEGERHQKKLSQFKAEEDNVEQQLKQLQPGAAQVQQLQTRLQRLTSEVEWYGVEVVEKLNESARKYSAELLDNMNEVINSYSRKNGYTLVIRKQEFPPGEDNWEGMTQSICHQVILYCDVNIDLTDKIIKILNEKYK